MLFAQRDPDRDAMNDRGAAHGQDNVYIIGIVYGIIMTIMLLFSSSRIYKRYAAKGVHNFLDVDVQDDDEWIGTYPTNKLFIHGMLY